MSNNTRRQLVPLPSMPSSSRRSSVADTPCGCGCGELVARVFAPGHDARLAGWVKRVLRGVVTLEWIKVHASKGEALATERAIKAGTLRHIDWAAERAAQAARLKAERKGAKAPEPEPKEEPQPDEGTGTEG